MNAKQCSKCGKFHPVGTIHFFVDNGYLSGMCRACKNAQQKTNRSKHPEKVSEWNRKYREGKGRGNAQKYKARRFERMLKNTTKS